MEEEGPAGAEAWGFGFGAEFGVDVGVGPGGAALVDVIVLRFARVCVGRGERGVYKKVVGS